MYGRAFLAGLFAYGIARPAFATHAGLTTAPSSVLSAFRTVQIRPLQV
jgi:hypothetical protein